MEEIEVVVEAVEELEEEELKVEEEEDEVFEEIINKPIHPWLVLTNAQKAQINQAFDLLDQLGHGLIDTYSFKIAIKALGYEVTSEELKSMIASVGESKGGKLSSKDFTTLIMRKITEKDTEFDIVKSFLHFDIEDNDYLTVENIKAVVETLGEDLNDEEIYEMFVAADENEDGCISKEEFVKMINHKCVKLVTP